MLDAIKSSLKHGSIHINQQKIITRQFLASTSKACSCHHKFNHQHKHGFAVVNKHWLQTTTNIPVNHPQYDLTNNR
jgi:hypothetical protein